MKNISVIGGGIIGLCSAYYLAKEGHKVTIFDRSSLEDGCSYGNAGMIVPSHIVPLAQPGMIRQGIRWMFDSKSPFYVKPSFNREFFEWGIKFYKFSNQKHVENAMPALKNLSLLSKELYKELDGLSKEFFYQEKGLLMLFQNEKMGEEMIHEGKLAERLGLEVDFLSKIEVTRLEKGTKVDAIGGVHYKSDAHVYPQKLMAFLKKELESLGVVIKKECEVMDFTISKGIITEIVTSCGIFVTDEVVLATGAWSPLLAKKIGKKISLLPGKGYSFSISDYKSGPSIPSILCEGKVAVTPLNNQIRFGGTMEITNVGDNKIRMSRVEGIVNTVNSFYPEIQLTLPKEKDIWHGFRPCTPSGMPIITRDDKISNLIFATGHAMMGLSLAPATGKIVSEIVAHKKTSVSISSFQRI